MTGCEGIAAGAEVLAGVVAGGKALGEAVGSGKAEPDDGSGGLFAGLLAVACATLGGGPRVDAEAVEVPSGAEGAAGIAPGEGTSAAEAGMTAQTAGATPSGAVNALGTPSLPAEGVTEANPKGSTATAGEPSVQPAPAQTGVPPAGGLNPVPAATKSGEKAVWVTGVQAASDGVESAIVDGAGARALGDLAGKAAEAAARVSQTQAAVATSAEVGDPGGTGVRQPETKQTGLEPAVAEAHPGPEDATATAVESGTTDDPATGDFAEEARGLEKAALQAAADQVEQPPQSDEAGRGNMTRNEAARPFNQAELRELPQFVRRAELAARAGGPAEMRVQLVPEHLGRLSIRVTVAEGGVTARLLVATPEVKTLVEQRLPELERALREQGLRLDSLSVGCEDAGAGHGGFLQEEIREQFERGFSPGAARRQYEEVPAGLVPEALAPAVSYLWTGNGSLLDALV